MTFFLLPTAYSVIETAGRDGQALGHAGLPLRRVHRRADDPWAVARPAVVWATAVALLPRRRGRVHALAARHPHHRRAPAAHRHRCAGPAPPPSWWRPTSPRPIEAAMQAVRGVRKTSSESSEGQSRLDDRARPHDRRPHDAARDPRAAGAAAPRLPRRRTPHRRSANYVPEELEREPLITLHRLRPVHRGDAAAASPTRTSRRGSSAVPGVAGVKPAAATPTSAWR